MKNKNMIIWMILAALFGFGSNIGCESEKQFVADIKEKCEVSGGEYIKKGSIEWCKCGEGPDSKCKSNLVCTREDGALMCEKCAVGSFICDDNVLKYR